MKIIVLQGPNLNLIGLKAARTGERITLDKINKEMRLFVRKKDVELKIMQTHRNEKAVTLLQRNRNWADGIILAPMSWCTNHVLNETLELIQVPAVQVLFSEQYSKYYDEKGSIFTPTCLKTVTGHPSTAFNDGIDALLKILQKNNG